MAELPSDEELKLAIEISLEEVCAIISWCDT
jgi:hypothetical protein